MANRLKALLMLLVIGLVLPTGAMPRRFCTISHSLLSKQSACVECSKKSCCKSHSGPGEPGCIIVLKGLPDTVHSTAATLPAITGMLLPEPFSLSELPETVALVTESPIAGPAPPDPLPLYLAKKSLLL